MFGQPTGEPGRHKAAREKERERVRGSPELTVNWFWSLPSTRGGFAGGEGGVTNGLFSMIV